MQPARHEPRSLNFCCSSPPSKPAAFEQFKEECGSEINRIFKENKSILLARKKRSGTVARRINFIRQEMEDIQKALEAQRQERWQQGKSLAGKSRAQRGSPCLQSGFAGGQLGAVTPQPKLWLGKQEGGREKGMANSKEALPSEWQPGRQPQGVAVLLVSISLLEEQL